MRSFRGCRRARKAARATAARPDRSRCRGLRAQGYRADPSASIRALMNATPPRRHLNALTLGALGVVYGDIGTSPLYALRECFARSHGIAPDAANVLGVLSLMVWSLVLIVCIKYVAIVLRADNRGEGGILALLALAT